MNSYNYRPITFENHTFHPSVMGIDVLEYAFQLSEETADWVWRFPICCGVTKSLSAKLCHTATHELLLFIPERIADIRKVIEERVESDLTYQEIIKHWIDALEYIHSSSSNSEGDCYWSAPSHPDDKVQLAPDHQKFTNALNNVFKA